MKTSKFAFEIYWPLKNYEIMKFSHVMELQERIFTTVKVVIIQHRPQLEVWHESRARSWSDTQIRILVLDLFVFTLKFLAYKKRQKHEKNNVFKKNFFAHKKLKKLPSKVAHNSTRPRVFSPASIWLCGTETVL